MPYSKRKIYSSDKNNNIQPQSVNYIKYIAIAIILFIAIGVYNGLNWFEPSMKKKIDVTKAGAYVEFDLNLKKAGCYEVGFGSYDFKFNRDSIIEGVYKLQYFTKDYQLIKEKTVTEKDIVGTTDFGSDYTNAVLDMDSSIIEYTKMKVRLSVIQPFKTKKTIYFYAIDTEQKGTCSSFQKYMNELFKQIDLDSMEIDIPETNETLKPLYDALWKKDISKIKEFIPNRFDADVTMVANHKSLHYAAYLNDIDTMRYLLSLGAQIDAVDVQSYTPLHYAVESNSLDAVKFLMDRGADPNKARFEYIHVSSTNLDGRKPILLEAMCRGYEDLTAYLLQSPKIDKNEYHNGWDVFKNFDSHCFDEKEDNMNKIQKLLENYKYQEAIKYYKNKKANQTIN
jgi:hypothetical protein